MAIKKTLDLQVLKRSSVPKNNKIYEKAIKMMAEGYFTPELSHMEIEIIAERFVEHGLRTNVSINGDITVRSKCDNWVVVDEGWNYTLYHETTVVGNRGKGRHSYHIQDIFYDLDFLLASIVTHDKFKTSARLSVMEDVQDIVKRISTFSDVQQVSEYIYQ